MKVRTDCSSCRQRIHEEEKEEFLKKEYTIFRDCSISFATFAVSAVLMAMVRRGRTPKYIRQLYDEMCFIFDTPEVFGKQITMSAVMETLEKDYGIDWNKLNVNIETEKQFISGAKQAAKGKAGKERK